MEYEIERITFYVVVIILVFNAPKFDKVSLKLMKLFKFKAEKKNSFRLVALLLVLFKPKRT